MQFWIVSYISWQKEYAASCKQCIKTYITRKSINIKKNNLSLLHAGFWYTYFNKDKTHEVPRKYLKYSNLLNFNFMRLTYQKQVEINE